MRPELLAVELEAALGAEAVQQDPDVLRAWAVDGKIPRIRCAPRDPDQVGAALRLCAKAGAAVVPWGGGTAMQLGNVPRRVDVVLSLEQLHDLVEHDDANLTATMQAGMTVARLQDVLGRKRQFLAIDPPLPRRATIGGVVAANTSGPRRMLYGGVRDLVIGMKMVMATGEQIKAGGKVVKNVAGYDMCKLFVGSLGTLGVITEVTFKMAPLPETAATIVARGGLDQLTQLVDAVFETTLLPSAVAILSEAVAAGAGIPGRSSAVAIWAEGFEEAVTRHVAEVQAMAEGRGLSSAVVRGAEHQQLWSHVRDFGVHLAPDGDDAVVFRIAVPLAAVAPVVVTIDRLRGEERPAQLIAHAGAGVVHVALPAAAGAGAWFSGLTALAQEHGGHAILAAAPPAVKDQVDVWGPPPPALGIMREIKRQFDPQGLLNPGRFVARL